MAKVGIVMGSDSDMPVMSKAADILEKLGVDYEMTIISAHREPDVFFEYVTVASSLLDELFVYPVIDFHEEYEVFNGAYLYSIDLIEFLAELLINICE